MNWAISISERLQFQKALKNISYLKSSWLISVFQGAALLVMFVAPFLIYKWLSHPAEDLRNYSSYLLSFPGIEHPIESDYLLFFGILQLTIIPYLLGWIYFGSSLWISLSSQKDDAGRIFVIFCSAAAISITLLPIITISRQLDWLWLISLAVVGGSLINFALVFPEKKQLITQHKLLPWMGYVPGITLTSIGLYWLNGIAHSDQVIKIWTAELIYIGLAVVVLLLSLISTMLASSSQDSRQQARRSAWGLVFTLLPVVIWIVIISRYPQSQIAALVLIPMAVFPIIMGIVLRPRQKLKEPIVLQHSITYALLTALTVCAYFLIVSGVSLLLGGMIAGDNPLLIGSLVFFLAIALNPIRNRIQESINGSFQRNVSDSQQLLQTFAYELTRDVDVKTIVNKFQELVEQTISPSLIHLYLYDPSSNQYTAAFDHSQRPTSDLRFPQDSDFVQFLVSSNKPFNFSGTKSLPTELKSESNRVSLLGAVLFIPLPGQKDLIGWLALGPPRARRGYNRDDVAFLEALSGQAAIAIERSLVISNLERRVREMDVLTRIAQGVNITLDFDDILELIYTQTNLVIPTVDFRVTLQSSVDHRYVHAFYLEDDERLAHNENINIPSRQGLEEIVIQNQRALLTSDYELECRKQGVIPNAPGVYAWMGVPLNAGSETVGAISLGCRDPSIIYTEHQRDLLQAIADQAAGAIVKAQLLAESERRARQLAKLNEVGRSLISTLDINPLLTQIMNSAVEILNCEAGSLVMIDENTRELVFEVTVGPIASDFASTRLPAGTGLVGKVAETGEPVIANLDTDSQIWMDEADQQTGFLTRNFLAVPMKVKEKTIGVIEVINKLDGGAFTEDDLGILSTFTSQAAISVENARLYTHTDEALSARLEEMSVMQRIDRELNTSLDVDRTMRITLDWSINYANAEAGLIGFIEKTEKFQAFRVNVITFEGFDQIFNTKKSPGIAIAGENSPDFAEFPAVLSAVREGQPILSKINGNSPALSTDIESQAIADGNASARKFLLEKSRSQAIIPIRRKTDVIGLILLESSREDNFNDDTITFLTRLSDHAAIAISNALLYADLQAANIAKSEFVSLVSHELKTPMTSIRGYTDLLAQETVGPINEIQSNFLNTIRSNVNRMSNLVSDLADVSRIEAGRMRLEFGSVSISNIIQEVLNSVNAQLAEKDHILHMEIPDNLPNVWGDFNRLIQVMNNLLSNAIKYTPQHGKIEVACKVTEYSRDNEGAPQFVLISVIDSGFGISTEDHDKIFHKFFRSSDQNIRDVPGTGLGLNITRHLVEMQGGEIWFESKYGKGSTFNFTVPVAATD